MYTLTAHYVATSDFIDPRVKITLVATGADAPIFERNVPFTERALTLMMAEAQRLARAANTTVDVRQVEYLVRVNRTGPTDHEIATKVSLMRLKEAAAKKGLRVTEHYDLVPV